MCGGCSRRSGALQARGLSVLYISHVLEEVQEIADRFTVLRDGRTVGGGEARAGRARRDRAHDGRAPDGPALPAVGAHARRRRARARRRRRRREARVGVARRCGAARWSGIGGLVGAGRTELLRAVFGLDPVRRGTVRVAAWSGRATPRQRLAQGVGLLSEDRKAEGLALSMSLADNMTLSRLAGLGPGRPRLAVAPARRRRALDRAPAHPLPRQPAGGQRALGRQPAEGGARPAAPPRRGRVPARRADARHRRRQQGRDLRAHRRARARGQGDPDRVELPARAARRLRSRGRDAPRAAGRRAAGVAS